MKARTLLGCRLRRDPRHYRFPVPNEVWKYRFRPTEFVIFSYLCYRRTHGQVQELSPEEIADGVHLSVVTVMKHLAPLTDRGILNKENECGNFFSLPNEIFLLGLSLSAFMVYAYLVCCEDRRTHQCHPSYRTMARTTGLSLNTVMKAVGILIDKRLISAESTHWFNEQGMKRKGNNVYTVLPVRFAVDEFHQRQLTCGGVSAVEKSAG